MLRTHEIHRLHTDGVRARRSDIPRQLAAAPLLSPRRRSLHPPRQLQAPPSRRLTLSVAKNAPRDRSPATTPSTPPNGFTAMSQNPTSPMSANNELADLADSQKPALFYLSAFPRHQKTPQKSFSATNLSDSPLSGLKQNGTRMNADLTDFRRSKQNHSMRQLAATFSHCPTF